MLVKRRFVFAVLLIFIGIFFIPMTGFPAEQKVIHVWHTESNPASVKAVASIIADFEKLHPDIKVEAEALAWTDLEGKMMASLAAGNPPELSHGQPVTCASFYAKKIILPLDEVVKAIGEDNIWDQIKRVGTYEGHYYGLVHAAGTSLLIYRKDIAKKKGLKPPKTWDDFLKICKEMTVVGKDGKVESYGLSIPGDNLFINILMGELVKANGGILFDDKNKPQFTDKRMMEVLDFLKKLTKYLPPGWEGHAYMATFGNIATGKANMMFQGYGRGAGLIEQYAPKEMANADYFGVWVKPRGPSGKQPAAQVDEETWMLFKDSKHPKEAIEFLKFFYKDEQYLKYIQSVPIHFFPITKSLRKNADYKATPMIAKWKEWLDVQGYYLEKDLAKPTLVIDWKDLTGKPYLMEILGSQILYDMVMEVVKENVPAEKAAAKAQQRAEELITKAGYKKW